MSSSDFCVCANEASPGATVLKNAFVKNGDFFFSFLGVCTGLLVFTVVFFDEGGDLVTSGAVEVDGSCLIGDSFNEGGDLVTCGAAEDLVTSGAVEVDGSCLIGDSFNEGGDLVTCGAAEDLVTSGAVEIDGSCLIGESVRGGGSLARSSSSGSNAVLQKSPLS